MKNVVAVAVAAICCIALITCVGLLMGHNSAVIAGGVSAISGIAAALGSYYAAKSRHTEWTKEEQQKKGE
jgi:hypothetical protein